RFSLPVFGCFFFSSRRRHTRFSRDWSSDVCSSDLWLIVFAGIADTLDGRVARVTRTGSRFGEELDSLVDAISFGVAPAFIIYHRSEERRVGKECRSRCSPQYSTKKRYTTSAPRSER